MNNGNYKKSLIRNILIAEETKKRQRDWVTPITLSPFVSIKDYPPVNLHWSLRRY